MKERTFRKPSVREIFEMQGIELPARINEAFLLRMIDDGKLICAGDNYRKAVETIESLRERQGIALFLRKFRVAKKESDYGIKSLDDLVKIDSQQVLRKVSGEENVPSRLTRKFLEKYEIWPYTLMKTAVENTDAENPVMGVYWVGIDNHVRTFTWTRATAGAEMQIMKQREDFSGKVIDKKPYGRNLRVAVASRTEDGVNYKFSLFRLPMHRRGDIRQFSDWINISHNSSDPDASYRGGEHEKRTFPIIVWSASTIFSFYDAIVFVKEHPEWKQFRINPFPIPTNEEMIGFIDNLRLRSMILDVNEEGKLDWDVLNKSEMDKIIGARTKIRGYDNCWHHWGKKDLSYLYTPKS